MFRKNILYFPARFMGRKATRDSARANRSCEPTSAPRNFDWLSQIVKLKLQVLLFDF